MRADRGRRFAIWVVVSCACLACRVAWAEPIPVNFNVQYQRIEFGGVTREYWSRYLDANYSTRLNPSLQLTSQFRIDMVNLSGQLEKSVTPYGLLRLTHTNAGISGSLRPTQLTSVTGLTTKQQEAQITGFIAPNRLPRFDLEWTQRHQLIGERVAGQTGTTRNGRMSWTVGVLDLRGDVGDIAISGGLESTTRRTQQQNWDAGAGVRTGHANWNLNANFDMGEIRRNELSGTSNLNRTQTANTTFSQRLSHKTDWNLTYEFRATSQPSSEDAQTIATHDGAATMNYRPTRGTQIMGAFGVRPVTSPTGSTATLGYTLLSATAQGRVRAGWTGIASAAQSLNRQADSRSYWVGTYHGGSRLILAPGLNLDVDATVTDNGDTAVTDQRVASQGMAGISMTPLRRLVFTFNLRGYRAGPNLGQPVARSTSRNFDLRWRPWNSMDLGASVARSGALPKGDPTLTTKQLFAHISPGSRLQVDLNYSNSDQFRRDAGTAKLPGREVWSGRLLAGLGRTWRISGGGALSDPGKPTRSRQFDVSLSARLGVGS
jgi:hypothetical protein